jgi:hypothetical protein
MEKIFNEKTQYIVKRIGHSTTTNNHELHKLGKDMFANKFMGVYSSNTIPYIGKNQYLISNLDKSTQPGSHWVALCRGAGNRILIFDSFGRPTRSILPSMIGRNFEDTDYDTNQHTLSKLCGQKCLSFIYIFDKYGFKNAKMI